MVINAPPIQQAFLHENGQISRVWARYFSALSRGIDRETVQDRGQVMGSGASLDGGRRLAGDMRLIGGRRR